MGSAFVTATRVGPHAIADPTAFGCGSFNFSWGDHICAIFEDAEQQMAVMLPFMAQGLCAAQRCVWIGAPASTDRFRGALAGIGADLPTLEASGQLVIISNIDFYLRDGLFDPERVLELGLTLFEDGQRDGWEAMRITGEVPFVRDRLVNIDRWESYEEQVTRRIAGASLVAVCQYSRRGLPAAFIDSALRTHPIIILGESIHESPFYAGSLVAGIDRQHVS